MTLGYFMLPKTCLLSCGTLPVCIAFGSVGGLWLNWSSICVSYCCFVIGVCSVVAVSPSLLSSFTVIRGGKKNMKESIRRGVFFSDFSATADLPANGIFLLVHGLSTGLHCFIATTWLGSNEAPGLLSKFPHLNHMMETFLPKTNCTCDMAQSRMHGQLFTNIRINTKNIAMLNKQPTEQSNPWLKAPTPGFCGSLLSASDFIV